MRRRTARAQVLTLYTLIAVAVCAALYAWQGDAYWSYSEGVYAETARELVDGADLYDDVAVAQPPPVILAGAAVLEVDDSIWALRAAIGIVAFLGGAMVALAVWRLTGSRAASIGGGLAALVTPWALHGHGHLLPESFAGPLLLGAALLAATRRRAAAAGAVAAVAVLFKLAFVLPAAALVVTVPNRR